MKWSINLDPRAARELERLDPQIVRRINRFIFQRIAFLEDPRCIGEALKGKEFGELWKYRVGDYRIIAKIEDKLVRILVVRIGNRREVYR
jgi:mRNA interferase RelE/StbE